MEVCGVDIDFTKSNGFFLNADCMDGMKEFPDKYFDLAIVDPPYGIGITNDVVSVSSQTVHVERERGASCSVGGGAPFGGKGGRGTFIPPKSYHPFDDNSPPTPEYFEELKRVSKNQIIWGGNYFLENLSSTPCFIFWDKCRDGLNFADGELAWTSFKRPTRRFTFRWNGMLQGNMKEKEFRIHPTQKPVELYAWILNHFAQPGDKILDTHVGSASSLIACHRLGFQYVGFELDEYYFKLASERLEAEKAQISLFD